MNWRAHAVVVAATVHVLCACTAPQLTLACQRDAQYQPIGLAVLQAASIGLAPVGAVASLDQLVVHPGVVAVCAAHGATLVLVPTTMTTIPTPTVAK